MYVVINNLSCMGKIDGASQAMKAVGNHRRFGDNFGRGKQE